MIQKIDVKQIIQGISYNSFEFEITKTQEKLNELVDYVNQLIKMNQI